MDLRTDGREQHPFVPVLQSPAPLKNVLAPAFHSPTRLARPAFLMSFPFSWSTGVPNNVWMTELSEEQRQPNFSKAAAQFLELYRALSSDALVYLLPAPSDCGLQDLPFTANLAFVPEGAEPRETVILANFTSEPRRGESAIGRPFFESLGYTVHVPPARFEGDAEIKHLHDNIYVGGYGERSERAAYEWMERTFDMEIIKVKETEPHLYHLDCTIFPITRQQTLVCTELFENHELAQLEKHTGIIDVSVDDCFSGVCNSVRLGNSVFNASHIHDLKAGTEDYELELRKNHKLEEIASRLAMEVSFFNLSEFHKSGALLSCMVMHLNRHSYEFQLTL
jgi:N-dimethylarginine dimethylaminohydrolase